MIRDEVSEDVAPAVREACEAAIEELRRETGGEVREIELPELAAATLADGPDRQQREPRRRHPASASTTSTPS